MVMMRGGGCPQETRLSQHKTLKKKREGREIKWSNGGGGPSHTGLSHHATPVSPQPQVSWATLGRVGPGKNQNHTKRGGEGGWWWLPIVWAEQRKNTTAKKRPTQKMALMPALEIYPEWNSWSQASPAQPRLWTRLWVDMGGYSKIWWRKRREDGLWR